MIVDTVTNLSSYAGLSPRLATAFKWLESTNLAALDDGELKIDGD